MPLCIFLRNLHFISDQLVELLRRGGAKILFNLPQKVPSNVRYITAYCLPFIRAKFSLFFSLKKRLDLSRLDLSH